MISKKQLQIKNIVLMSIIFFMIVIGIIATALVVRLFLSTILWLVSGTFDMSWVDVVRGIKIGFVGGAICVSWVVLVQLFIIKGFYLLTTPTHFPMFFTAFTF